jgi:hypothetical protein
LSKKAPIPVRPLNPVSPVIAPSDSFPLGLPRSMVASLPFTKRYILRLASSSAIVDGDPGSGDWKSSL